MAVNLLNNYFFFVGQLLFLCIYFLCKLSARDFRLTGRKFGHLLWESVLGVAMGCLLLFPAVLSLLQNPRTIDLSSGWGFLTYSKVQQYLAILLSCLVGVALLMSVKPLCWLFTGQSFSSACRECNLFALFRRNPSKQPPAS